MDERTKKAVALLYKAAVEARKLHDAQTHHFDNLVAVAAALHDLSLERPLRSVGGYSSSGRAASELTAPPSGPAPGARNSGASA